MDGQAPKYGQKYGCIDHIRPPPGKLLTNIGLNIGYSIALFT